MQTHSHVRLHPARLAQLRVMADDRKETIAETVEHLISKALEDTIHDLIPGLMVMEGDNNVLLTMGTAIIGLTPLEAVKLAGHIKQIVAGEDGKGRSIEVRGYEIIVGRRGRAVLLRLTDRDNNTVTQSLTYSLAGDFQRQLVRTAEALAS